jgi:uncharacterized protein (DUF1800 family)
MHEQTSPPDPGPSWAAYTPTKEAAWDLRRVVHLHRRAGFAATWEELQRDLKDGPARSIDRLLAGKARSQGVPPGFDSVAAALADNPGDAGRLKAWWVYRMLFGPDPLAERLTLLWHNHFATSIEKVRAVGLMRRQNDTFRRLARAPFGKLLHAAAREPALLVWLDAPSNRKGQPNENLARELMELFTLGVGNYSEKDVKEAARALTGWNVAEEQFREDPRRHDDGEKTILGKKGRWKGDDLVKILLDHPATARRLAWRLCELLMGEGAVDDEAVKALADGLRKRDLDVGWAVETVLRSRAFFAERNLGSRVAGPVEFVVNSARALEMFAPAPSTLVLADWCARLGQDLFAPPNVGGWKGGRDWLSPQTMIGRANFAAALVAGRLSGRAAPLDALALARKHGRAAGLDDVLTFYAELLLGGAPSPAWRRRLLAELGPKPALDAGVCRRLVVLVLSSPEAQLL